MVYCVRCKKRPAVVFMTKSNGSETSSEGYCINCARDLGIKPVENILKQFNITDENLDEINEQIEELSEGLGDDIDFESILGGAATFPFASMMSGTDGEDALVNGTNEDVSDSSKDKKNNSAKSKGKKHNDKKRKCLNAFCTDLTGRAREGKIDRIIGRDKELYRVTQILSRRQKNNPCLIGEPGVGKTAIAEGLALKIANGEVPVRLSEKEIFLLDLTALVAGTQFRGQFEKRIKDLIDEVKADGNIILFIDEVHNLIGTGESEGSMNAANILKPALSRGEIQVIGATTFSEYRKYIEKDAALERRFQPVTVEEPSIEETIKVLDGIKTYYEEHHNVTLSDEIIRKAVVFSERYINDRFLPDKAIDLLDEACACASLRNKKIDKFLSLKKKIEALKQEKAEKEDDAENLDYDEIARLNSEIVVDDGELKKIENNLDNAVTDDDLAKVIELWTGIPASKVKESDLKRLASLEENVKKKIIGQDEAVDLVAAAVRRSRVHISPRRRPASFIFIGSTGVGKTELVKVLSMQLFNTPETLIRLDMSEFMEKHSVSRIIGAPPGYVGYDEAGQLTEKVRRKPYSVILFDEIEKAHPDVMNILLQILDEGRITDAQGRTVNFENTVIFMTSNAGSSRIESALGFNKTQAAASKEKAMKALEEFLRPEFISRVDEVVFFAPLSLENYAKIAGLMMDEIKQSLNERKITLEYNDDVLKLVAEKSFGGKRGARDLRNYIRKNVEDKLAYIMVSNCDTPISRFDLSVEDGELNVEFK